MIEFGVSSSFRRAYKRVIKGHPEIEQLCRERLSLFVENPFEPSLLTHKLGGQLKGQRLSP